MKRIIAITVCSLFACAAIAQNNPKTAKVRKTAIAGTIKDSRWEPVAKIQAYIYRNDTIIASGFSTATGYYETNSVMPGVYTLKLVYPQSGRRITVPGVPLKMLKLTTVNYTGNEPAADTTIGYNELMPEAAAKKK